jgi:hypothetical protein
MNIDTLIIDALNIDIDNPQDWDQFFEFLILQGVDVSDPEKTAEGILQHKKKFFASVLTPTLHAILPIALAPLDSFDQTGLKEFFQVYGETTYAKSIWRDAKMYLSRTETKKMLTGPFVVNLSQTNGYSFGKNLVDLLSMAVYAAVRVEIPDLCQYMNVSEDLISWVRHVVRHTTTTYLVNQGILSY